MGKIAIFKEDNNIGDRVVIYRNFGNEDIEGVVSEIGESYVVLLRDNGRKARIFEDIISGWDTISESSVQIDNVPIEEVQTSNFGMAETSNDIVDNEIIEEGQLVLEDKINLESSNIEQHSSNQQVPENECDASITVEDKELPTDEDVNSLTEIPKMGFTIVGKIDLSKCGDPRFKNLGGDGNCDTSALNNTPALEKIEMSSDNQSAVSSVDGENMPTSNASDEPEITTSIEENNHQLHKTTEDDVKSFIKGQYEQLNSSFNIDENTLLTSLENISLDYINDVEQIKGNAEIVGIGKTYCMIEKEDGIALKCYFSRVADYNLLFALKDFQYGDRIPILACTYIQKSTEKEIVTAICGIRSPKDYLDDLIGLIDEGNFVFAKLLYDATKFNGVFRKASLSRANKPHWNFFTREMKTVTFSQLDLPLISLDLKESSDTSEKSIFKQIEQKVKRLVELGDISKAVDLIDKTVEDGSISSKYISNLMLRKAQLYSSVDDSENAQVAYSDLISYNESVGASKNNLSHLYTELARLLLISPDMQTEALNKLEKAIELNPSNKVATALKSQILLKKEDEGKVSDGPFEITTNSSPSVLSKMIDIDIQEHRFTDKEILERNNIATAEIAMRLYEEAAKSTDPEQYPKYLEAAKAFSGLKVGSYNLQSYLYVIANYSRLKGNYLCNLVKRLSLSTNINSQDVSNIRRLKDSAQSYYLETLDLWSSISEDSFDIENGANDSESSKDEVLDVVLEVLANYLKLDVAYYYLSNRIVSDFNAIFSSNFSEIFKQCIKSKNAELEKIAYRTVVQIGSYSLQVWTKLYSMENGTKALYSKFDSNESKLRIYSIINSFLDGSINTSLNPGAFLQKAFAFHTQSRNTFETKTVSLQGEVLGPHNIAEITEKWESLSPYWSLLSDTEMETKEKVTEILSVLKPYLSRKDAERTNLLIKSQGIIDNQIQFINENTTYYGRTFFFPLLNKWKKELKNILDERIALTNPVLDVKGDPMYVLNEEGKRVLNLVITNSGESSADGFVLTISLSAGEKQENMEISDKAKEIAAGDRIPVKIDLTGYDIVNEPIINIKASVGAFYLSNLLTPLEYDFSVESERDEFTLTDADILWSDTRTPDSQMFVGREEILTRLVRHYSSIEKHEPYILYGLTRTGKSSILQYLAENINGRTFRTRDSKEYNIIPIFIDFSQGASLGKASDFWNYVINECVFPQLDELSITYEHFKCNGDNPRAKDFGLLLTDLKGIGLYPLFLIDEFSYIRTLIDKDIVTAAFLHSLRQYSLDGKASFIYAGTYDVKSLIKDAKYGFTGALVTAHDEEIGKIDSESAEELMDAMHNSIVFTDDAKSRIHELSGDIPYFVQIICKNLGFFAVENKRKFIGYPELEKIVNILIGKDIQDKSSLVRVLPENRFQNNQYTPLDPPEVAVLISSIVEKNRGLKIPRGVSYAELQEMWGAHGISDFRPKLASAIGLLVEKKVLIEYQDDGVQVYKLAVDLFRLWWENHHKDINRELSTIM